MVDDSTLSPQMQKANRTLRFVMKPMLKHVRSQNLLNWLGHQVKPPKGPAFGKASSRETILGHVPTIEAVPDEVKHADAYILYFHGGAYTTMSARTHAPHACRLSALTGITVGCPDYTIAINAPYPAAVDDAEESYDALLRRGFDPVQIALCGDSAGGGLVFALLQRLKAKGRPMPACAATQSPWVDLTLSLPSIDACESTDVVLSRSWLERAAKLYAGGQDRRHPELSPVFADLSWLPPQLILFSQAELFRDECALLVQRLEGVGVETISIILSNAPHAWPITVPEAPEADTAFERIAEFISTHLKTMQA